MPGPRSRARAAARAAGSLFLWSPLTQTPSTRVNCTQYEPLSQALHPAAADFWGQPLEDSGMIGQRSGGRRRGRGSDMIKSELIARLAAENPHLTQRDIERVVGVILEKMTVALEGGGRVELRGFGAFSVRSRPARAGRNPRTGEPVSVKGKHVPFFKSGKELRERLNAD